MLCFVETFFRSMTTSMITLHSPQQPAARKPKGWWRALRVETTSLDGIWTKPTEVPKSVPVGLLAQASWSDLDTPDENDDDDTLSESTDVSSDDNEDTDEGDVAMNTVRCERNNTQSSSDINTKALLCGACCCCCCAGGGGTAIGTGKGMMPPQTLPMETGMQSSI